MTHFKFAKALIIVGIVVFLILAFGEGNRDSTDTLSRPPTTNSTQPNPHAFPNHESENWDASKTNRTHTSNIRSFKGAMVDGSLEVDTSGNLVITRNLKDLFDYFLSAFGQKSLDAISQATQDYIKQTLPEPARTQALLIFQTYIGYKYALAELELEVGDLSANVLASKDISELKQMLADIRRMRRDYLSDDVADAFFSDSERYDQYSLQRMEINHNPLLSQKEKNAFLIQTEQMLPESLLKLKERTTQHLSLKAKQLAMTEASTNDIHNMRITEVGIEAANRLAELDNERAQWQQRLQNYQLKQDAIKQSGLSKEDQNKAVEHLLQESFNSNEIRRIHALERLSKSN